MAQSKKLPSDITSYDFFKAVAVILMIIDHIGWYFFPEGLWWRAFGRLCVPIWFFLIGYARSRDLSPKLWIGGGVLVVASIVIGQFALPLNILFSILIVRILLDQVMEFAKSSLNNFAAATFILTVLVIPSMFLWEYGTQAFLLAMFGYAVRHKQEMQSLHKEAIEIFLAVNLALYAGFQYIVFLFDQAQILFITAGLFFVFGLLWRFEPATYPKLSQSMPGFMKSTIQFFGRRTLEIYIAHLLIFKAAALFVDPETYQLFNVSLFPPN